MTNNPTIDGVSRELLKKWRRDLDACQRVIWLAGGFDPAYCIDAQECLAQIDSILDAPVVYRQEPGYVLAKQTTVEVPGKERKERKELGYTVFDGIGIFSSPEEVHAAISELGLPIGWVSMTVDQLLPGYMMTNSEVSEVAALQSTIDQLQTRVAELESGRGEPFAWYTEDYLTDKSATTYDMPTASRWKSKGWPVQPLFIAPPAPVAVDEQQAFADWTHEVIGMRGLAKVQRRDEMTVEQEKFALKGWLARACLDATAALNPPKTAEWHDVAGDDEGLAQ